MTRAPKRGTYWEIRDGDKAPFLVRVLGAQDANYSNTRYTIVEDVGSGGTMNLPTGWFEPSNDFKAKRVYKKDLPLRLLAEI